MSTSAIDRAGAAFGGLAKLARALNVTTQAVCQWRDRPVPVARCAAIEELCNKKVRRWDLRPDDWHLIWPELRSRSNAPPIKEAA